MAGIVHGGGLTAAIAQYGGMREDWLDLSTGINPNMPALPDIPVQVWNWLPDKGLVDEARAAAREFYLGVSVRQHVQALELWARELPPSVLPDISPTRGESSQTLAPWHKQESESETATPNQGRVARHLLSPLVGEMSGRTEGGEPGEQVGAVEKTRTTSCLPLPIPGTQSLIQILPRLISQNRPVAVVSPTYGEYAHCFKTAGFDVDLINSPDDLRPDHGTLIVVNPNNPDGTSFEPAYLLDLHARLQSRGGHLHVDEAFADARPDLSVAREASELTGLTASRSFGKFFGMAGLRLGFVFAEPSMLERIEAELGPWAVSGPALYIAREWMRAGGGKILDRILERKAALEAVLKGAGLRIAGGTELFALIEHRDAGSLFEHLARSHILVRKFDYRADWLRVGLAGDEQGDRRLAAALASFRR